MKVYYKVTSNTLKSCVVRGELCTQYKIGEFVSASIGGLLVFEHLGQAKTWCSQDWADTIFICECKEPVWLPPVRVLTLKFDILNMKDAEDAWIKQNVLVQGYWPEGTRAFKYVKLLREVQ